MTSPHSVKEGVCRHGSCVRPGSGKPPLCEEHKRAARESGLEPTTFEPIPESRKMAGNARIARRRV